MKKGSSEMVYFFGLLGALVYYVQQASNLSEGIIGVVKAFIWPAVLVHRLLGYLGM